MLNNGGLNVKIINFVFQVQAESYSFRNEDDKENVGNNASDKPVRKSCSYGGSCYRKNPLHRRDEAHPGDDDYKDPNNDADDDEDKPECEYGTDCYRKNPQHRKQFKHSKRPQKRRAAKAAAVKKKKKKEDDYDSDDSFINDEDDWEPVDDSDDDADFEPAEMSSELDREDEDETEEVN